MALHLKRYSSDIDYEMKQLKQDFKGTLARGALPIQYGAVASLTVLLFSAAVSKPES
jgi:hypothetical protein